MTALMAELLELRGTETVLEVGSGSGYHAAVLGQLAARVISVEIIAGLAGRAEENLRRTGLGGNVAIFRGDGSRGWPAGAPYGGISVAAAARELEEELGFKVPASAMTQLGPWTLPTPAVIAECHVFFHVEVDPDAPRPEPTLDGSALERGAAILSMPVYDALEHCRRGGIRDAKTELGLRRLSELLPWAGLPSVPR